MKSLLLALLSVSFLRVAVAQNNLAGDIPVARQVSGGVWVYLGKRIPKNIHYLIERKKENDSKYENTGSVSAPVSESEMEFRQKVFNKYFVALDSFTTDVMGKLWSYIESHSNIDSTRANNLPLLHLLAGTAYFDTTADKNSAYKYRITLIDADGNRISQMESNLSTSLNSLKLPAIHFSGKRFADGRLTLIWTVKGPLNMAHFNVYRTVFGKQNYQKVKIIKGVYSTNDSLMLMAIDTIGNRPVWYEYKITAVDAFGSEGEMQGYADGGNLQDYYAPPITNFKAINTHNNHEVKLTWSVENKKYLNGISIMRSRIFDSGYIRIATVPVEDTMFTDILPVSGENFYYYLLLLSANNNPVPSAKIFAIYTNGNEKPNRPDKIDAATISNGIKIYWSCDARYVKGFYVYRRSKPDQVFLQVSPLIAGREPVYSFDDTTKLMQAGDVYEYVVRAMSENNRLSDNSDTVSAYPGKKIILTPPMNLRYINRDNKITILWDNMGLWTENLLGYKVFRKENNSPWVPMKNDSLQPMKNFFVDSVVAGKEYIYAVSSIDFFGNESNRSIIVIPAVAIELPSPPSGITLSQTPEGVYISWGQINGDISGCKIYRSEPGQKATFAGSVAKGINSFVDKNVVKNKLYFYQIASVDSSKREGNLSEKISLRVN